MIAFWMSLAFAAPPVRPVLAAPEVRAEWSAYLEERGKPLNPLACEEFWAEEALLCFQVAAGGRARWVTEADLKAWAVSAADLRAAVAAEAASHPLELRRLNVQDMDAVYFRADGARALDGLFQPAALRAVVGAPLAVSVPVDGVLLAWRAGNPLLDQVIAVAASEAYAGQTHPVTPTLFRWEDERWVPYLEAHPKPVPPLDPPKMPVLP